MRTPLRSLFPAVLVGLLTFALSPISEASDRFKVTVITEARSADLIKVGTSWRKDLPKRIKVSLRVTEEMPASKVKVKGYFYDKENNLVLTANKPNAIWTQTPRGFEEILLPNLLEKGKPFDVYFALPEELEAKKWKTLLVVFGDSNEVAAKARPASAIDRLSFPEEALARKEKD